MIARKEIVRLALAGTHGPNLVMILADAYRGAEADYERAAGECQRLEAEVTSLRRLLLEECEQANRRRAVATIARLRGRVQSLCAHIRDMRAKLAACTDAAQAQEELIASIMRDGL